MRLRYTCVPLYQLYTEMGQAQCEADHKKRLILVTSTQNKNHKLSKPIIQRQMRSLFPFGPIAAIKVYNQPITSHGTFADSVQSTIR